MLQSFVRQVWQMDTDASTANAVCSHTFRSGAFSRALSFSRIRLPQSSSKCPAVLIHLSSLPYLLIHCLAMPSLQYTAGDCDRNAWQSLYAVAWTRTRPLTRSPYFSCSSSALDTVIASAGLTDLFSHWRNTPAGTSIGGCLCNNTVRNAS